MRSGEVQTVCGVQAFGLFGLVSESLKEDSREERRSPGHPTQRSQFRIAAYSLGQQAKDQYSKHRLIKNALVNQLGPRFMANGSD